MIVAVCLTSSGRVSARMPGFLKLCYYVVRLPEARGKPGKVRHQLGQKRQEMNITLTLILGKQVRYK